MLDIACYKTVCYVSDVIRQYAGYQMLQDCMLDFGASVLVHGRSAVEAVALLGYCALCIGSCLPTFRDIITFLRMGPMYCPETSVNTCQPTPRNASKERSFQAHRYGTRNLAFDNSCMPAAWT